jgi:hypothetical protein
VEEIIRAREFSFTSDDEFRRALLDVRALPTKPPREMPAPEWIGPDRWQTATSHGPTVGNPPDKDAPEGYQPIGAWQPFASGDSWTDWRRPLRRVQA